MRGRATTGIDYVKLACGRLIMRHPATLPKRGSAYDISKVRVRLF
jgi:hypothetical protein